MRKIVLLMASAFLSGDFKSQSRKNEPAVLTQQAQPAQK